MCFRSSTLHRGPGDQPVTVTKQSRSGSPEIRHPVGVCVGKCKHIPGNLPVELVLWIVRAGLMTISPTVNITGYSMFNKPSELHVIVMSHIAGACGRGRTCVDPALRSNGVPIAALWARVDTCRIVTEPPARICPGGQRRLICSVHVNRQRRCCLLLFVLSGDSLPCIENPKTDRSPVGDIALCGDSSLVQNVMDWDHVDIRRPDRTTVNRCNPST